MDTDFAQSPGDETPPDSASPADDLRSSCIVVADDEPHNVALVRLYLEREGYTNVHCATTPEQVRELCESVDPDLLVLDLHMPERDGYVLLEEIAQSADSHTYVPVLVITGDTSAEAKSRALILGASDVVFKPADMFEVCCRIGNLLRIRRLNQALHQQKRLLEERIRERTRALEAAQLEVLERLAHAAEFRDDETGQHTRRVGELAGRIAEAMHLPACEVDAIRRAAPLHDVGKIGIPDSILLKPGPLTAEEFEVVKHHTTMGAAILASGHTALLRTAEQIARHHHERWDGSGYPDGLAGEQIPLAARITALADYVDALSHERPYRGAWSIERIFEAIRWNSGKHFDPCVVEAFWSLADPVDSDLTSAEESMRAAWARRYNGALYAAALVGGSASAEMSGNGLAGIA